MVDVVGGEYGKGGGYVYHLYTGSAFFGDNKAVLFPALEGSCRGHARTESGGVYPGGKLWKACNVWRATGGKRGAGLRGRGVFYARNTGPE